MRSIVANRCQRKPNLQTVDAVKVLVTSSADHENHLAILVRDACICSLLGNRCVGVLASVVLWTERVWLLATSTHHTGPRKCAALNRTSNVSSGARAHQWSALWPIKSVHECERMLTAARTQALRVHAYTPRRVQVQRALHARSHALESS